MTKRWMMGAAAAALTVATAVAAQAADLPTRKEAPAPIFVPPPFTWTGFYVGANAGGIWETGSRTTTLYDSGYSFLTNYYPTSLGSGESGFLGGAQAGYNYQSGAAVFGIETDFDWTSLSKNYSYTSGYFGGGGSIIINPGATGLVLTNDGLNVNASAKMNWIGTTRLRVGFVATPDNRLMFYGTGGIAYGGASGNLNVFDNTSGLYWHGSPSSSRVGWTIGAGVEYAITNSITVKGEYLYYDLGSSNVVTAANAAALSDFGTGTYATAKYNYNGSIFRAGVNYKF